MPAAPEAPMRETERDDSHFIATALTFWSGVTFAILWRPHLVRVVMGSAFIVVVLLVIYSVRWIQRHRRGEPSDAVGATWRSLIAFSFLAVTAMIINGGTPLFALA